MILGLFLSIALVLLHHQLPPPPAAATTYDIVKYGAKSDGSSDSSNALSKAWSVACDDKSSDDPPTVYVPAGTFLLSGVVFQGSCNSHVTFLIDGTLVAPSGYDDSDGEYWVLFDEVDRVTIHGGPLSSGGAHLDGSGAHLWECKSRGGNCPVGRNTLGIMNSNQVSISKIRLKNSQLFNVGVCGSKGVTIRGVSVENPSQSPNTDGIHVEMSNDIIIANVKIRTGDDCVFGPGTSNMVIRNVQGGPGHGISLGKNYKEEGVTKLNVLLQAASSKTQFVKEVGQISIGSLGKNYNEEGVTNVSVSDVTLTGTTNGVRIKTFAQKSQAFVSNVVFQGIQMNNVENPILIDQKYCPNYKCNKDQQGSGVQISSITYRDIQGTSATKVAVNLGCSGSHPCDHITLTNIKLQYVNNEPAETVCSNTVCTTIDKVEPKISCTS